jgi:hypothetical protein
VAGFLLKQPVFLGLVVLVLQVPPSQVMGVTPTTLVSLLRVEHEVVRLLRRLLHLTALLLVAAVLLLRRALLVVVAQC